MYDCDLFSCYWSVGLQSRGNCQATGIRSCYGRGSESTPASSPKGSSSTAEPPAAARESLGWPQRKSWWDIVYIHLSLRHQSLCPLHGQLRIFKYVAINAWFLVGSRSEALASLLLELHGLQDMLDRLWEWVGGAEATLAATEANPVGNDLDTVERQLSEHEVHIAYLWCILLSSCCILFCLYCTGLHSLLYLPC